MNTSTVATDFHNLPLGVLIPSKTNPRRIVEDDALRELAESIRVNGVIEPLIVRPIADRMFEVVAGGRRYLGSKLAERNDAPCHVRELTDAQVLEIQLIENLQRRDVHPLEEAQGFRALLNLAEPHYSIEQIAAKMGKTPPYITQRVKLTDLTPPIVEAFYAEEIGVGHALLLAKLPPDQQERALGECFREEWAGGGKKAKRILLPVSHLRQWIERQLMLLLKLAPFNKRDAQLVPAAGSCVDCPKRTGHNKLLFADVREDACTDPTCYAAKVEAHVQATIAAKPKLVQISTGYGSQPEGSQAISRNKYVEICPDKADTPEKAKRPEYKTCKDTTEAIVTQGIEKGELRKVCANPDCSIHNPKKQPVRADAAFKAQQDKERREQAVSNTTGIRVLAAIVAAVPVRLMKRDLLFIADGLLALLDERKLSIVARNRSIKTSEGEFIGKRMSAYLRNADEGGLGRFIVEARILLSAGVHSDGGKTLKTAAQTYKVDTDAIALKVKQEFNAKEKAKRLAKVEPKTVPAKTKKAA